tara:strand:+ start:134153 stop:135442 length:1290 start_codon:yes stop_codon:yes gene_type:complete
MSEQSQPTSFVREQPSEGAPARPSEFRYWENIDKPLVQRIRRLAQHVLRFDLAPSDERIREFAASYYDADPLAEAFVRDVVEPLGYGPAREMLDTALRHGAGAVPDAPEALRNLFADLDADPQWLDWEQVELGAKVFRRYGSSVFRFAGAITLQSYAENSIAKALILAGGYEGSTTRNRFLETASFWIDVSEPRGLQPGSKGRSTSMRVRIMHVFVRRRLAEHAEWDEKAWGTPISQGDAVLTLMGGSAVPGLAMQALGYRPSKAEILAMMHFWRYVGHIMGVRPRWYPANLEEAIQLLFVNFVKGARQSGEDGKRLCQSFAHAFEPPKGLSLGESLTAKIRHRLHMGYTQFFSPPRFFGANEMRGVGLLSLYPLLGFPLLFGAETLRRKSPMLDKVADRVARKERQRWFDRQYAGRHASYKPKATLSR